MAITVKGNQAMTLAVLFFGAAWVFGLMYYWDTSTQAAGLDDKDADMSQSGVLDILIGAIEFLSWTSPFGIVKGLIYFMSPPALYEFMNLFLLRPLGWVCSYFFAEWIIFTIRGIS